MLAEAGADVIMGRLKAYRHPNGCQAGVAAIAAIFMKDEDVLIDVATQNEGIYASTDMQIGIHMPTLEKWEDFLGGFMNLAGCTSIGQPDMVQGMTAAVYSK